MKNMGHTHRSFFILAIAIFTILQGSSLWADSGGTYGFSFSDMNGSATLVTGSAAATGTAGGPYIENFVIFAPPDTLTFSIDPTGVRLTAFGFDLSF